MQSRFSPKLIAALVLAASALPAATGYSLQGPVLAHLLDPETGSLHRVDGIPGASGIGAPLSLDFLVAQATVAPNQEFAIVRDGEGRSLVIDLSASPPSAVELTGALVEADGALISPSSRHAALYSAASGQIQFLSDLSGTPTAGETLALEKGVGEWTAFSISDMGVVLVAAAQADSGSLYTLSLESGSRRIGAVRRAGDLAFFAGSNDAVIADTAANEIILIRDVLARRQTSVIASADDEIANPFSVKVTADGRYVAVAMPGGVATVPVFGGVPVSTPCACTPTSLVPLAGGNVFQLTADVRNPLQIVEVGAESRVLFIPALPAPDPVETNR